MRKVALEIIAFLFILLFLYAAFSKVADYRRFVAQVGQSPVLTGFGGSIPWIIISGEVFVSLLLAVPRFRLIAFLGSFSLMTAFTTYIIVILNFSRYVPCSCGGILEKLGWTEHLIFNFLFVGLAFLGIVLQSQDLRTAQNIGLFVKQKTH